MTQQIIDCTNLDLAAYNQYLDAKQQPQYHIINRQIIIQHQPINTTDSNTVTANEAHLFDYQHFIVNLAAERQRYAVYADCGLGKAQPLDALILTPSGWKKMGEIKVGNAVYNHLGKITTVSGVYPQGEKDIYRVTFSDGASTECCNDHLWNVQTFNDRRRSKQWRTLPLSTIKQNLTYGKNRNSHRWFIPISQPVEFPSQDIPLDAYLLGLLLGNGSLGASIDLSTTDTAILSIVTKIIGKFGLTLKYGGGCDYCLSSGRNGGRPNPIKEAIKQLGLLGHYAETKFIPECYKINSVNIRKAILQGLLDTDGYYSIKDGTVQFTSISKQLINDVTFIVQSLGGVCRETNKNPTFSYKGEKRNGQKAYTLTISLPNGIEPFRTTKATHYIPRQKYLPARAICTVELIGRKQAQCIAVAEESTYLTNDFIVTHNTSMALAWIQRIINLLNGKKVLIIAPLMVIQQWQDEEKKFYGCHTIYDLHNEDLEAWANNGIPNQVGITNPEKFHETRNLNGNVGAVVLDESSILKNTDGKTRTALIESTRGIPYKLCLTATPAPNDREEYANHATFLEYVRSNNEFYSMFFVNRDNGWEIKPHGLQAFYQYLSTWSVFLRDPARYGFKDNLQNLPKPQFETIPLEWTPQQKTIINQLRGKPLDRKHQLIMLSKGFIKGSDGKIERVTNLKTNALLQIIAKERKPTVIWVTYNYEQELIYEALKTTSLRAAHIDGTTSEEDRVKIIGAFRNSEYDVLISKPKLLGFGLNLPFVTVQIFSGLTDSYEQFYQCVRRSHRFGATEAVKVYLPVTAAEQHILSNVMRKKETFEADANKQESDFIKNLQGNLNRFFNLPYQQTDKAIAQTAKTAEGRGWKLYNGDSTIITRQMQPESADFAIFSPPFSNLFTYSNNIADMGNTRDNAEFYLHFEFFLKGLYQVLKQGRICCCHLSQLAVLKSREGYIGLHDFRGDIIRLFQTAGFIYYGEWCIAKNPQMQAIKEKVRTLSFAQLEHDRLGSRPGLNDYILIFKKPGNANVKINDKSGPTRDEWINWAQGVWTDIKESDTLNARGTKTEDDVKHICPMNLTVIDRLIRMYTAPGEVVFDPFNGIGSSGVVALRRKRQYRGIELKQEYFGASIGNLEEASPRNQLGDFLTSPSLRPKLQVIK
jgi:DNA modification methylase/superfamily II DNA or RNA helicase